MMLLGGAIVATALTYHKGDNMRKYWFLIGMGSWFFILGNAIWFFFKIGKTNLESYYYLPDFSLVVYYVLVGIGLYYIINQYAEIFPIKKYYIISSIISVIILFLLILFIIIPEIINGQLQMLDKILQSFYILGNVIILLAPLMVMTMVMKNLKTSILSRPWWMVISGLFLIIVSSLFTMITPFLLNNFETYYFDYGWMLGYILLGCGAVYMQDLNS